MSHTIGETRQDIDNSNSNSHELPQDTLTPEAVSPEAISGLSDADYEFLFNQLLEGIGHGWHDQRIIKFFKQLGDRGKQSDWVSWLQRLRSKLIKLPMQSKRQLGTMMIRLGELTQSTTEVNQIGAASHAIGRELLFGNVPAVIWEYTGPDLVSEAEVIETAQEFSARLPDDFSNLGDQTSKTLEADAKLESDSLPQAEINDDDLEVNPWFDDQPEPEVDTESSDADQQNIVLQDTEANIPDIASETVSGEEPINLEPETTTETTEFIQDLDLDLDSEFASSPPVSSYGDEFEFELDGESVTEEAFINSQPESLEDESLGNAVDLLPKLSISAPHRSSDPIETSKPEAEAESKSTFLQPSEPQNPQNNLEISEQSIPESSSLTTPEALDQDSALEVNSLGLDVHSETVANTLENQQIENQQISQVLDNSSLELIESWFNLGLKQVSAGEYNQAITSWDKALAININLSEAWHNRGSALGRLGNYAAAVKSFQNALKIDPDNYQAWNDRAHALYQLENWSEAIDSWNKAISIMPGNHLFWYNRGCALEQLEQWQEAISSYEKSLEIKPDFQPGRSRYINLVADNSRPN